MSLSPWAFKETDSITQPESISEYINDTRTANRFLAEIQEFYDLRSQYCDDIWDFAIDMYKKYQTSTRRLDPTTLVGRDVIPARVYGYIEYLMTQVMVRRPKFLLRPDTAKLEDLALHMETFLNNWWKRAQTKQCRLAVKDCGLTGAGWVWVGCEVDKDKAAAARMRRKRIAQAMQDDPALAVLGDQVIADVISSQDSIDLEESMELTYEMDDRVKRERIYVRHTPHKRMVYDPTADSDDNMLWVGEEKIVPIDAVKADKTLQNTEDLQPSAVIKGMWRFGPNGRNRASGRQRDRFIGERHTRQQFVALYPVYAKNHDGTWDGYLFAKGHKPFLKVFRAEYDMGCPATRLVWNDNNDEIFVPSDISQGADTILTEQLLKTRLLDATSREAEDILLYDKEKCKDIEQAMHDIGDVGLGIPVTGGIPQGGIRQIADFLQRSSKVDRLLPYLAILERDYELAWGMGPNQQLQAMRSGTSATESATVAQTAQLRMSNKADATEGFVGAVGLKVIQCAAQFLGPEQIGAEAGEAAAAAWQREDFTKGDIQNGLSVEVEIGSMRPETDQSRMEFLNQVVSESLQSPVLAQTWQLQEVQKLRAKIMGVRDGSKILNAQAGNQALLQGLMQMMLMQGGQGGKGSAPAQRGQSNAQAAKPASPVGGV